MYPSRVLILSPLVSQSWPSTLAWPLVGGRSPSRILIKVDLPAPFAPTSPVTPGATLTVSPSSAVTSPGYTLVSTLVSMTAWVTAGGGSDGSEAWLDDMVLPCQRAGRPVITRESEVAARAAGPAARRRERLIVAAYTCRMTPRAAVAVTVGMCAFCRPGGTTPRDPPGLGRAIRPPKPP